jgi:hypothetical protein
MRPRPRVFAIRLKNYDKETHVEKNAEHLPIEWLDAGAYDAMVQD